MISSNHSLIPPIEEVFQLLRPVWADGKLTNNGTLLKRLEEELRAFLDVPHLYVVSSGTMALQLAIRAYNLQGEIITTPFSFIATTSSILWERCQPVFVDIDPMTLCIDPDKIEEKVSPRTAAILPTHVFGNCCDVDRIEAIAKQHGLTLIYDGAHAFGTRRDEKSILATGDCCILSMQAYKLFNTVEGGAVICRSEELAEKVYRMRYFGKDRSNDEVELGINAKLSELHAAFGLALLKYIPQEIRARRIIGDRYLLRLKDARVRFMKLSRNVDFNYAYYPVIVEHPDILTALLEKGHEAGMEFKRYFPSLNRLPFLGRQDPMPISEDVSSRIVCLPIHGNLRQGDQDKVIDLLRKVCQ
jgi:dTDP-4-amino-4,6-dideoxygalactose transaminase